MIGFITKCWKEWRKERSAENLAKRKYNVARAFNGLYTATHHGLWMCPDCNTVHKTTGFSAFTGQQFPDCCRFVHGHRCFWKSDATQDTFRRNRVHA